MSSKVLRERITGILVSHLHGAYLKDGLTAGLINELAEAMEQERPIAGPHFHEGREFDTIAAAINAYVPKDAGWGKTADEYAAERFELQRWLSAAAEALSERGKLELLRDRLNTHEEARARGGVEGEQRSTDRLVQAWCGVKHADRYDKFLKSRAWGWFNAGAEFVARGDDGETDGRKRYFRDSWERHANNGGAFYADESARAQAALENRSNASDRVRAPVQYDPTAPRELTRPPTGAVWMHVPRDYGCVVTTKDAEGRTLVAVEALDGSALLQQGERGDRWEIEACRLKRELDAACDHAVSRHSFDMRLQIARAFGWRTDFSGCEQAPTLDEILTEIAKRPRAPTAEEVEARDNVGSLLGIGPKPTWARVLVTVREISQGLAQIRKDLDRHGKTIEETRQILDQSTRTLSGVKFSGKLWGAVHSETHLEHAIRMARAHLAGGKSEPLPGTCRTIAQGLIELIDGVDVPATRPEGETWIFAELVHLKAIHAGLACVKLPPNCRIVDPNWPHGETALMPPHDVEGPVRELEVAAIRYGNGVDHVTPERLYQVRAGLQRCAFELALMVLDRCKPKHDPMLRREDDYQTAIETLQRFQRRAAEDAK